MVQGWRTYHTGRFIHKTYTYKWLNNDKESNYNSNHINMPIGWQLSDINKLEYNLNNTFKHKHRKDRNGSWTNDNKRAYIRSWAIWEAWQSSMVYKSPKSNPFNKISLRIYSLYKILRSWKLGFDLIKINKIIVFCKIG